MSRYLYLVPFFCWVTYYLMMLLNEFKGVTYSIYPLAYDKLNTNIFQMLGLHTITPGLHVDLSSGVRYELASPHCFCKHTQLYLQWLTYMVVLLIISKASWSKQTQQLVNINIHNKTCGHHHIMT